MANEKRLIDANALTDTIEGIDWYHVSLQGNLVHGARSDIHTPLYKADDIYRALENAPAVDTVEVVHGRWEKFGYDFRCSACGVYQCGHYIGMTNYCPNCGAKMDGGNEDGG